MASQNKLIDWFEGKQAESTMKTEPIPLDEVGDPWGMHSGEFQRKDERFFRLTGAKILTGDREVSTWKQPLLEELGPYGIVALVQEKVSNQVLVTAKAEPGNDAKGRVLLSPSFQASSSNLEQAHGGSKPPLAQILDMDESNNIVNVDQSQDGGRYLKKKVNVRVIQILNKESIAEHVQENQGWASLEEVKEAILKGLCNPFLRDTVLHLLLKEEGV